jgi:hypothetical protein
MRGGTPPPLSNTRGGHQGLDLRMCDFGVEKPSTSSTLSSLFPISRIIDGVDWIAGQPKPAVVLMSLGVGESSGRRLEFQQ